MRITGIDQVLPQDPAASTGVPFLSYHSIYVPPEQTCLSKEHNLKDNKFGGGFLSYRVFTGSLAGVHRREAGLSEMTLKTKELF